MAAVDTIRIDNLEKNVDNISKDINDFSKEVSKDLNDINKNVAVLLQEFKSFDKAINGNGQPGILQRLSEVETNQKNCPFRNEATPMAQRQRTTITIASVAILISVVAICVTLYVSL